MPKRGAPAVAGACPTQGQQFADVQSLAHLADDLTDSARRLGEVNERNMQARAAPGPGLNASFIAIRYSLLIMGPIAGIICGVWVSRRFNRSISPSALHSMMPAWICPRDVGRVDIREAGDLSRLGKQVDLVVARIRQVNQELHQGASGLYRQRTSPRLGKWPREWPMNFAIRSPRSSFSFRQPDNGAIAR